MNYRKCSIFFFNIILLAFLHVDIAYSNVSILKIKDLYLKSFDFKESEFISVEEFKKQNKKLSFQIQPLSDGTKRKIAFEIAENYQLKQFNNTILDQTLLKKMEFLCGSETQSNHLLEKLNRTETIMGEIMLAILLANPTHDIETLKLRQALLKELIEDPIFLEQLHTILTQIKEAEPFVFSYWDREHPVNEELFKKVYFGDWFSRLNKNSFALECWTRLGNLGSLWAYAGLPVSSSLYIGLIKYAEAAGHDTPITAPTAIKNGFSSFFKFFDPRLDTFKEKTLPQITHEISTAYDTGKINRMDAYNLSIDKTTPKTFRDLLHIVDHMPLSPDINISRTQIKGLGVGVFTVFLAMYAYGIKNATEEALLRNNIVYHLQTKLIAVASYLDGIKKLYSLSLKHPMLAKIIEIENMTAIIQTGSGEFKTLLSLLNHKTFKDHASFFSLTGKVLAAHQLMKQVKNEFRPLMHSAGLGDTFYSIAKLITELSKNKACYSFVKYIQSDTPYINLIDFWNPFIDPKTVITNDIELGTQRNSGNIIVTGPNTGGKSTIIKGMLINLLLAQSFGIASAGQLIMTPFAHINCYLNITDDIAAGTSLFKAEVIRAKALIESIRNLQQDQFSFTIMDEIFSGTSPKEGEEAAYMFAQELAHYPKSMCCIATHYGKLTELPEFKNYHVNVEKTANGSWKKPFKIETGKSTTNIAFDLIKEEGIF